MSTSGPIQWRAQLRRLGIVMRGDPRNPDEAMGVLNPAAARGPDGGLYLFPRVVGAGNYSRIGIAKVRFDSAGDPVSVDRLGYALEPSESWERNSRTAGCEDARVTYVESLGCYVMTYTAYGPTGPRIAIAYSADLRRWERLGPAKFVFDLASGVDFDLYDNKDAMLFPSPVRDPSGKPALAILHRPGNTQGGRLILPSGIVERRPSIWISYCSLDRVRDDLNELCRWRDHQLVATPRYPWEELKIGAGTPPVRTARGWLIFYHGVTGHLVEGVDQQTDVHYRAGAMVLDATDPRQVLYRSPEPVLSPELDEERQGIVANVVFPTGVDYREGGRIDVYYGAADVAIGVARLDLPPALIAR